MNNLLHLSRDLNTQKNTQKMGTIKIPKGTVVSAEQIDILLKQINNIIEYWKNKEKYISGTLVSVHYTTIVAKSNRLTKLFSYKNNNPSEHIRGAKFEHVNNRLCHVITYYVPLIVLKETKEYLQKVQEILKINFQTSSINFEDFNAISSNKKRIKLQSLSKTCFLKIIHDISYVRKFDILEVSTKTQEKMLVTIYQTNIETKELLSSFGITIHADNMLNNTTLLLSYEQYHILVDKAPYLISMAVSDFRNIADEIVKKQQDIKTIDIPSPTDEPIVGVIDTHFNKEVYFKEWVEYKNTLDENIELTERDFFHGTAVTSIIVDGPRANPKLDDNCGRFRVKHFGVATAHGFSSFAILKVIRNIVRANTDIKVWNLSLGSVYEINENYISPEGAELDKIQNEFDVIFIIAGTNKTNLNQVKIGAPADSLNSIVVNSVNFNNQSASYTRKGPVLSFFYKPDVSYYGGDGLRADENIVVCCDNNGAKYVKGTSFSAPWITRKIAFLIYKMGLSREIAKALIIDAAAAWKRKDDISFSMGYGIVPIKIDDIVTSPDDEIKFFISGVVQEYETFTYNLPIPLEQEKYPFWARTTLVYFPDCNRDQGVDYTNIELDLKFGRVTQQGTLKAIDNNKQTDNDLKCLYEEDARSLFRKWDNVKHICEDTSKKPTPRKKISDAGLWGLNIKYKERLTSYKKPLNFGIIVTLKEMNKKNKYSLFYKLCEARGWFVNEISVENALMLYHKSEQDITLE